MIETTGKRERGGAPGMRWTWAGLLCALAALPLWSMPAASFGFEPDKARLAVLLVLGGFGLAVLLDPAGMRAGITSLWSHIPRPARFGLAGLTALTLFAPLWSVQASWSVWGSPHRGFGSFTQLALTASIIAAGLLAGHPGGWQAMRRVIALAGSWVGMAGIWWALGWPLPALWQGDPFLGRAFISLGNPDFLGSFLLLALPVMGMELWAAWRARRRGYAGWLAVWTAVGVWLLWRSGARGAWLGLTAAGALAATLAAACRRHRAGVLLGAAASLVLATAGIWILAQGLALPEAAGWLDPTGSGRQRGQFWGELVAFLQHDMPAWRLVLGYGPDAQGLVLPNHLAYRAPVAGENAPLLLDRAHNALLDILLTQGAAGLACWAVLGVGAVLAGLRALAPRARWRNGIIAGAASTAAVLAVGWAWGLPAAYWPAAAGIAIAGGTAVGSAAALWCTSPHHSIGTAEGTVIAVLAALVGHCVDLMVGFGTAGVSILAYALLGVLLAGAADAEDEKTHDQGLIVPALTGAGLTGVLVAAGKGAWPGLLPLMAVMWLSGMLVYAWTMPASSWRGAAVCSLLPALTAGAGMRAAGGDPRGQMLAGTAGMLICMVVTAKMLGDVPEPVSRPARGMLWRAAGAVVLLAGLVGAGWPAVGDAYLSLGRRALPSGDWARVDRMMQTAVRFPPYKALAYDVWAQRWLAAGRLETLPERRYTALEEAARMMKAAWDTEPRQVEWARRLSAIYQEWAESEEGERQRELLRQAHEVLTGALEIAPANLTLAQDLRTIDSLLLEAPQ